MAGSVTLCVLPRKIRVKRNIGPPDARPFKFCIWACESRESKVATLINQEQIWRGWGGRHGVGQGRTVVVVRLCSKDHSSKNCGTCVYN